MHENSKRFFLNFLIFSFITIITAQQNIFAEEKDENNNRNQTAKHWMFRPHSESKPLPGEKYPRMVLPKYYSDFYFEDNKRRFDVVFFLSLPLFFTYHVFLQQFISSIIGIRGQTKKLGDFSKIQWIYSTVSSLFMSFFVAYDDLLHMQYTKTKSLEISSPGQNNTMDLQYHIAFSL